MVLILDGNSEQHTHIKKGIFWEKTNQNYYLSGSNRMPYTDQIAEIAHCVSYDSLWIVIFLYK